MRKIQQIILLLLTVFECTNSSAQNTFPASGRAGINTITPAASLQVRGGARIGTLTNFTRIDSATGNLSFAGASSYLVAGNAYAFRLAASPNVGLYFNQSNARYETRDTTQKTIWGLGAYDGTQYLFGKKFISGDPNLLSTSLGTEALQNNMSGIANVAIGYQSMFTNSGGTENTAVGRTTLFSNSGGVSNTAIGNEAMYTNSSGSSNVAMGSRALFTNENGNANTAIGNSSMYYNTSGTGNSALGFGTLNANSTGAKNIVLGAFAAYANTTGSNNVSVGYYAMGTNISGYSNVSIGSESLLSNTSRSNLVAIGDSALYNNGYLASNALEGSFNTAVGSKALYANQFGYRNTATGYQALYNCGGNNNTAFGYYALRINSGGSNNTVIGASADANNTNYLNSTAIGFFSTITASNQVRIGNSNVISIGGFANWTNVSDGRVKKNIKDNVPGLAFINKLKPVTYNLDLDAADKITNRPVQQDASGKAIENSPEDIQNRLAKEKVVYSGFIAQDVEKLAKSLNYDFSGVDAAKNKLDLYGLRYADFVVPLVKAVQELSSQNEKLKIQNEEQQKVNTDLETRLTKLEAMVNGQQQSENKKSISLSGASLDQNIPNPFTNTTTIIYTLPNKYATAQMVIADKTGKTIKAINISGSGKGSLQVDASTLASGAYTYSLYVDGKMMDTKQMVLMK